jgi:hypothetical protein
MKKPYEKEPGASIKRAAHVRVDQQVSRISRHYPQEDQGINAVVMPGRQERGHIGTIEDLNQCLGEDVRRFDIIEYNDEYADGLREDFTRSCWKSDALSQEAITSLYNGNAIDFMMETGRGYHYADFDICGTPIHKSSSKRKLSFVDALGKFVENNLKERAVLQGTVGLSPRNVARSEVEQLLREALSGRSGFAFRQVYLSNPDPKVNIHQGMYRFALATWPAADETVFVEPPVRIRNKPRDLPPSLEDIVSGAKISMPSVQKALRDRDAGEVLIGDENQRLELPAMLTPPKITKLASSENVNEPAYA